MYLSFKRINARLRRDNALEIILAARYAPATFTFRYLEDMAGTRSSISMKFIQREQILNYVKKNEKGRLIYELGDRYKEWLAYLLSELEKPDTKYSPVHRLEYKKPGYK